MRSEHGGIGVYLKFYKVVDLKRPIYPVHTASCTYYPHEYPACKQDVDLLFIAFYLFFQRGLLSNIMLRSGCHDWLPRVIILLRSGCHVLTFCCGRTATGMQDGHTKESVLALPGRALPRTSTIYIYYNNNL